MRYQILCIVSLVALLGLCAGAQSESEFVGEGAIVAFHKQMRNPVTPKGREMQEFATRTDLWIVRIDRWSGNGIAGSYFLVQYWLYDRAVTNKEINRPKLRFQVRKPRDVDGEQPCAGMTRLESDPFKYRPMRMEDFQRTEAGRTDAIPQLKDLPCLIMEKPPTVVKAQQGQGAKVDKDGNLQLQIPAVVTSKPKR